MPMAGLYQSRACAYKSDFQLLLTGRCAFPEPNTLKTHIGDFAQIELVNTFTDLARVSGLLPKTPF
jgi:hypothetical protein